MEFDKVIKERRSCRKFSTKEIKKETIEVLIETARWSPSAANRQPWKFVIVTKDKKRKIANIMEKELINKEIKDIKHPVEPYNAVVSLLYSIRAIKDAPVLILVFRDKEDNWIYGDYLSIGSAVEHICLKATDLGLGTLWLRDIIYTHDKIATFVGHKDKELVVAIAVGYSIEEPYERKKRNLKDIIEWCK